MRTMDDMRAEFSLLGKLLDKYTRIEKQPQDFGVGFTIHPTEIHTVATLWAAGEMSISELAKDAAVTRGAMSQMIAKLEKKGLVYKRTAPDNQSKTLVGPTELGKQAQEGHARFHAQRDKEFLQYMAKLPDDEYKTIREFLVTMNKWMDTYQR
ncbi:MarR family transcriptional regulator [Pseudodesulfovibrio senegalensis]|uniref:MarR family transcriptional regulator n=2 Tax=Pseudodesulfovibrio senegalensis TaxID=1721087 RepID=A0A6N6MYX0_9BACT|nr:MarR family transcriptional regulator [Pseudodesulfovibrio senegalensis]